MIKANDTIRGDKIGRRANDWYIWVLCPLCRKGRWVLQWQLKLLHFTGLCQLCNAHKNLKRGMGSRSGEPKEPIKLAIRKPISQAGSKNANWKGGLTELVRGIRRSPEYYQWRKAVLKRDNHTCRDCGAVEGVEAHHIRAIMDYPEGIFEVGNGLTVCKDCHSRHTFWHNLTGTLN